MPPAQQSLLPSSPDGSGAPADDWEEYYPSLEAYDPHINKETWLALLHDPDVVSPGTLTMLKRILELGGESSCMRLAETYGESFNHYRELGKSLGEKVKKALQLPDPVNTGIKGFYIIPFVGKPIREGGRRLYIWKLRKELKEALMSMNTAARASEKDTDISLNTILCGPPGTGKTYSAALYAVAVIERKTLAEVEAEDHADVLRRYAGYRKQGRIAFTTFHQSYGYEEFIEGIRPVTFSENEEEEDSDIRYSVEAGVFKRFCETAERPKSASADEHFGISASPAIWKVSLEGTGDNPTRTECLENGHIRIGWDAYGPDITDETDFSSLGGQNVLNAFLHRMSVGDIVLSCYSASTIDAIGVVTGEYEWHDEYEEYKRLRKVHWIVKGIRENIVALNGGKTLTLSSVYRLINMSLPDVYALINAHLPAAPAPEQQENYVFIIDEINRGNISKIFGELITLLEDGRRTGQPEELRAILPCSRSTFGIPDNVYVIGTMNTDDRSIALMDTALRRRFRFREIMPRPELLRGVVVEGLDISAMLALMNRRIAVLYDREHTIGHAYFMPLKKSPTLATLSGIFRNSILPLLQEYFYEDYEKIRLVLGDNRKNGPGDNSAFIIRKEIPIHELFGDDAELDMENGYDYQINDDAFNKAEAYRFLQ